MMGKATRSITAALLAAVSLVTSVCAIRGESGDTMSLTRCPLMYSQGDKALSTGEFRDMANQAHWSASARATISALELVDAAGRGVSWETFDGLSLETNGKWIVQTPPAEVFNHRDGQRDLLDLLHTNVRCARRKDPGCHQDWKLYPCNGSSSNACPRGGTCRLFTSSKRTPEMQPIHLCGQPADAIVDRFYEVIASAQSYVDIVSLDSPDGHFLTAIRNALVYLQNAPRSGTLQVRLLFGHTVGELSVLKPIANLESDTFLKILLRDILPEGHSARLRVVAGTLKYWPDSWTHAKIVVADGKRMIQGGINFWQWDYLEYDPVFDLSMEISGPVAAAAVRFADSLWESPGFCPSWISGSRAASATSPTPRPSPSKHSRAHEGRDRELG